MQLSIDDVAKLRQIFSACHTAGIDTVVITEGLVRGTNEMRDVAIISKSDVNFGENTESLRIGLARMQDFEKRLQLFTGDVNIECAFDAAGSDAKMMTITGGKSKAQFRCTSAKLISYPKTNEDEPQAVITITKEEGQRISKASKTFKSERIKIHAGRSGIVTLECADVTNDQFTVELATPAEYVQEEEESFVFEYNTERLGKIIDTLAKEDDVVTLVIGYGGSAQVSILGHTFILIPQSGE
jgi:hypothetical protein